MSHSYGTIRKVCVIGDFYIWFFGSRTSFPPEKRPSDSKPNPIPNLNLTLLLTPHGGLFSRGFFRLRFYCISIEKFLLFSNENFQSIEKYLHLKHTRTAIEVSSPRFNFFFFFSRVHLTHFFTIMLKDAWNIRLM